MLLLCELINQIPLYQELFPSLDLMVPVNTLDEPLEGTAENAVPRSILQVALILFQRVGEVGVSGWIQRH